jgi:hypothetical protein
MQRRQATESGDHMWPAGELGTAPVSTEFPLAGKPQHDDGREDAQQQFSNN